MSFDESRRRRSRDCEKAIDVVTHERAMRDHVRVGRCAIHLFGDWVFDRSSSFAAERGTDRFRGAITIARRECSGCEATEEAARSVEPWFDVGYRSEEEILMAHVGNLALMNAGVADVDPVSILFWSFWDGIRIGTGGDRDCMCLDCEEEAGNGYDGEAFDSQAEKLVKLRVASTTFKLPNSPSESIVALVGRCDLCERSFAGVLRRSFRYPWLPLDGDRVEYVAHQGAEPERGTVVIGSLGERLGDRSHRAFLGDEFVFVRFDGDSGSKSTPVANLRRIEPMNEKPPRKSSPNKGTHTDRSKLERLDELSEFTTFSKIPDEPPDLDHVPSSCRLCRFPILVPVRKAWNYTELCEVCDQVEKDAEKERAERELEDDREN